MDWRAGNSDDVAMSARLADQWAVEPVRNEWAMVADSRSPGTEHCSRKHQRAAASVEAPLLLGLSPSRQARWSKGFVHVLLCRRWVRHVCLPGAHRIRDWYSSWAGDNEHSGQFLRWEISVLATVGENRNLTLEEVLGSVEASYEDSLLPRSDQTLLRCLENLPISFGSCRIEGSNLPGAMSASKDDE